MSWNFKWWAFAILCAFNRFGTIAVSQWEYFFFSLDKVDWVHVEFDNIFADAVVELANWDSSKVRDKLRRDIDAHVASVRAAKLSELTSSYEVWQLICPSLLTIYFIQVIGLHDYQQFYNFQIICCLVILTDEAILWNLGIP